MENTNIEVVKRLKALETAVQELLIREHGRDMRYVNGVLCEREPYSTEYRPVNLD